jgi:hypothetical protein
MTLTPGMRYVLTHEESGMVLERARPFLVYEAQCSGHEGSRVGPELAILNREFQGILISRPFSRSSQELIRSSPFSLLQTPRNSDRAIFRYRLTHLQGTENGEHAVIAFDLAVDGMGVKRVSQ